MLQALREGSKSLFMKVLLAILASTFVVFFGVSGNIGTGLFGNPNTLIEVGDTTYGQSAIARSYNAMADRYARQLGSFAAITPDLQRQILRQSVEIMVVEALFQEAASDLGLVASDELVAQQIRAEPGFQAGGQFNRVAFENYLLQTGQSEADYAAQLRQQIIVSDQYFGSLLAGLSAPEILAEYLVRYRREQRAADIAIIDAMEMGDVGAADSAQLAAYYEANKESFRIPALRSATILEISVDGLAEEMRVSDADIEAAYARRENQFLVPEVRALEQALFNDEATARRVSEQAAQGGDFAAAVRDALGRAPDDIGDVSRSDLLPVHAEPAFATPPGGVSEPFETPLGWMIVHVRSAEGGYTQPLDEVRDELGEQLRREMAAEEILDYIDLVDDAVAGGASLEQAAERLGLAATDVEPVSETGRNADGARVPALPDEPEVLRELFALDAGQVSTSIQSGQDRFFFVQTNEIFETRVPPLDEIDSKVQAAWQADRRLELARGVGQEIAAALADGASVADIENRFGYELLQPGPFTRDGGLSGLPPDLVEKIFAAERGDVVRAEMPELALVARVTEIVEPAADEDEELWSQAVAAFDDAIVQDLQAQLAEALRARIDVSVDQAGLERLFFSQ